MDVVLHRGNRFWLASFDGAPAIAFESMLVTERAKDVVDKAKALHPKARVGVKAAVFGPATVELAIRQTGNDIVWMK